MSLTQVKEIIEKAIKDEAFYGILMNKPEEIFGTYDLNDSEKTMIKGLAKSPYTQAKKGLMDTERLVMAAIEYNPAAPKKNS